MKSCTGRIGTIRPTGLKLRGLRASATAPSFRSECSAYAPRELVLSDLLCRLISSKNAKISRLLNELDWCLLSLS